MKGKNKFRIILDTNVFLVALPSSSKHYWIYQKLLSNEFDLIISNEILKEYEEQIVLRYGLEKADAALDFLLLLPNVFAAEIYYKWLLIQKDVDDNKFVDCAVASGADFIVTSDSHFKVLKTIEFPKIETISPDEFLKLFV